MVLGVAHRSESQKTLVPLPALPRIRGETCGKSLHASAWLSSHPLSAVSLMPIQWEMGLERSWAPLKTAPSELFTLLSDAWRLCTMGPLGAAEL